MVTELDALKEKLKARRNKPGLSANVALIEARIAQLLLDEASQIQ